MKLATKLLAAPLLTALVVLGAGQVNTLMMVRANDQNRASFDARLDDFRTLAAMRDQAGQVHAGVYRTVTVIGSMSDADIKKYRGSLGEQFGGIRQAAAKLADEHAGDTELGGAVAELGKQLDTYVKQADMAIDLSSVDPNTGIAALQGADATFGAIVKTTQAMLARIEKDTAAKVAAADAHTRQIGWALAALGLLFAAVAVTVAWLMQRKLTAELRRAGEIAREVASGNLTIVASSGRRDEVGDVVRAIGDMTRQLSASMRAVLDSSESIRLASAEIATGNQDLSSRTELTASNLQQAASSMEQLTGNVRQSADSARQADALAGSAAEVAARGGEMVSRVVRTMDDINASSRKIADIIGVIDGIAFQTNILALNAAVEAARAGEQGRGFAVVASEVRSLAQRSAQAAKEIKSLIGASVEQVEGGSRLVADAGQTMNEIVASVQRVSQIIGEISAASHEQSGGLGQVNASVTELDRMTQQNAALVEQSAAAAESLREQAGTLAALVNAFRLDAGPSAAGASPSMTSAAPAMSAAAASAVPTGRPAPVKAPAAPARAAEPAAVARQDRPVADKSAAPAPAAEAPRKASPRVAAAAGDLDEWETF